MRHMILVLQNRWVLVGEVVDVHAEAIVLRRACVVRWWGTTRGIGELVRGPLPKTTLDPLPGEIPVTPSTVLFRFDVGEVWSAALRKIHGE